MPKNVLVSCILTEEALQHSQGLHVSTSISVFVVKIWWQIAPPERSRIKLTRFDITTGNPLKMYVRTRCGPVHRWCIIQRGVNTPVSNRLHCPRYLVKTVETRVRHSMAFDFQWLQIREKSVKATDTSTLLNRETEKARFNYYRGMKTTLPKET